MTGDESSQVSPFGHLRVITLVCQLPEAYRRLPRPSSAFCAKAFTVRPFHAFYDLCVLFGCKSATFETFQLLPIMGLPTTIASCHPGGAEWSRTIQISPKSEIP